MFDGLQRGERLYYMNFMFAPLPGPPQAINAQMTRAIEKFYGDFCCRFARHPRAPSQQRYLPKLFLAPDLPVIKSKRRSTNRSTYNAGLHFNGPMSVPFSPRFHEDVIEHIESKSRKYCVRGIQRIDIKPVWGGLCDLADYALKTLKRDTDRVENIFPLPRALSELSRRPAALTAEQRQIKEIESRYHLNTTGAKAFYRSFAWQDASKKDAERILLPSKWPSRRL